MKTILLMLMLSLVLSFAHATEGKILQSVPDMKQDTDYSCGISSLAGVLTYYGDKVTEEVLTEEMDIDPEVGVAISEIIKAAGNHGIKAVTESNTGIEKLEEAVNRGQLTIVMAQAWRLKRRFWQRPRPWDEEWDAGHYMIVIGFDDTNIYFEDPWLLGSRGFISREDFMIRWHGPSDTDVPTQRQAIFFEGTPDLTRRVLRMKSVQIN